MAKQKSGLYRTKITLGHDADGTPIVKYISGKTKKELEEKRQEVLHYYAMGAVEANREVLFSDYVQEWYDVYKKPHISQSSRQSYESLINNRINPAFHGRQLRAISAPELQHFMNGCQGLGKTTIGYIGTILTNVFALAYSNGIIDRDPARALKKPAAEKESKRALTSAETAAVLKVGQGHGEGLLLLILYYTGVRRGEALGLQWRDVDFEKHLIHIRRDIDFSTNAIGALKSKYSARDIPMPAALESALRLIRGFGETFIIQAPNGSFLNQSTFVRRWDRLMRALCDADQSIESAEGKSVLTPHYFRHNYASILYNSGVDILAAQKFLGHADIKTTLSIYSHLSEGKELESADKVRAAFDQ